MAAQPPRPPPNNLLFCGPPPDLPRVVLLPSDAACDTCDLHDTSDAGFKEANDIVALNEINNVGVPTFETQSENQIIENILRKDVVDEEHGFPPDNYLRRTHSFDISDIYTTSFDVDQRAVFRHRQSEPDLSKYGLFIEAEVTVEPFEPLQPAPLVLNNPFYDGSFALDPSQLNNTMVVLPENYLAFEDSFVPTWDYKPELLVDGNYNTELYYDRIPMIPPNDPWSAYGTENAAFEYYSPHYETPMCDQEAIHYMPLTDLEYALPQYMSLPVMEQPKIESFPDTSNPPEVSISPNVDVSSENQTKDISSTEKVTKDAVDVSNFVSEDDKMTGLDSFTNRDSSLQSDGSLNDVTSSLAFVPNSKCSPQRPHDIDNTSNDTSPCSTDYQEASALDLVQNLDELSCCDSDYSQSRDDTSPITPEPPKPTVISYKGNCSSNEVNVMDSKDSNSTLTSLPLCKLPSIPLHGSLPTKLPPVLQHLQNQAPCVEQTKNVPVKSSVPETVPSNSKIVDKTLESSVPEDAKVNSNSTKVLRQPPQPPAVPPSWLPKKPPSDVVHSSSQPTPQIRVQNVEDQLRRSQKSTKPSPQAIIKPNQVQDPQPSCSFVTSCPAPSVAQLKPDKQPKEVEVSKNIINALGNRQQNYNYILFKINV